MQHTAGRRLHLRLFLEGIEVPIISVQVQVNVNAPATASIQIVPRDSALELKARTMVHVFFWEDDINANKPAPEPGTDEELEGYKLLFTGEVIGLAAMKSPGARQMVLQCADFSTYWDTCYQVMITYGPNGNFLWEGNLAIYAGGAMFDNIMGGHAMTLASYLQNHKPKTPGLTNLKGLLGSIVALLEAMGGAAKHSHGVNDFFTIAELKNHILQQLCCEQNDDTATRLFSNKQFWAWLMGGMGGLGEVCTFRDMLMLLFKYIYYEIAPNPAAKYVPMKRPKTEQKRVTTSKELEVPPGVKTKIQKMINDANTIVKSGVAQPQLIRAKLAEHENYFFQFEGNDDIPRPIKAVLTRAKLQLVPISLNPSGAGTKSAMLLSGKAEIVERTAGANDKHWKTYAALLTKAINYRQATGSKVVSKKSLAETDRLQCHIMRPDCFFAAPPRCNVIFPEEYMQFSYNRQFLQEITRLRLAIGWWLNPSGGGILGEWCYAPSREEINKLARNQGNTSLRALLPWEMYTGILPKFEKINDINFISNRRDKQLKKGTTGKQTIYSQRVANWNYMKYRFAARSAEVVGRFLPRFVCGWPTAVIDRPYIVDPNQVAQAYAAASANELKKLGNYDYYARFKAIIKHLTGMTYSTSNPVMATPDTVIYMPPTQYLGMLGSLNHSVDQKGGYTSLSMTHARIHRITDDDFLSLYAKQIATHGIKLVSTHLIATEILEKGDYAKLKFLIDSTPQNIPQQMQSMQTQQQGQPAVSLSSRPTGAPNLKNVPSDSIMDPYLDDQNFLLLQLPAARPVPKAAVPPAFGFQNPGGFNQAPLRGKTTTATLQGTHTPITVPDGPITVKKGPQKGKVVAIQLFSDAILQIEPGSLGRFSASAKKKLGKKTSYVWLNAVIWEEVDVKGKWERDIPVEESLRPQWFSPLYSSLFIGNEIYQPFFGCGSVVDETVFAGAGTVGIFGMNRPERDKIMAEFKSAGDDPQKVRDLIDQAKARNLAEIPSVETAIDALAYTYGEIKRLDLDVHQFVADYTKRPIATMLDIFGSVDLVYEKKTSKVNKTRVTGSETLPARDKDALRQIISLSNKHAAMKLTEADVPTMQNRARYCMEIINDIRGKSTTPPGVLPYLQQAVVLLENISKNWNAPQASWRSVATLLSKAVSYSKATSWKSSVEDSPTTLEIKSDPDGKAPIPGFHSTAIAELDQLIGLVDNPDLALPRLVVKGQRGVIDKNLDPRPGRRKQVKIYAAELQEGRGKIGSGLRG